MTSPDHDAAERQGRGDPLIDEVRALRRALQERSGGDLEGLVRHLQELEKEYADRVVNRAPE